MSYLLLWALWLPSVAVSPKPVFDPKAPLPSPTEAMGKLLSLMPVGNWRCEGNVVPPDGKSPRNAQVRMQVQTVMDGTWLKVVSFAENGRPADGEFIEFITFDPRNDSFVRATIDAQGGHSTVLADNTDGARLTFAGHQMLWDKRRDSRIVWEAQEDGLHLSWDVSGQHGDWVRIRALTCHVDKTRSKAAVLQATQAKAARAKAKAAKATPIAPAAQQPSALGSGATDDAASPAPDAADHAVPPGAEVQPKGASPAAEQQPKAAAPADGS